MTFDAGRRTAHWFLRQALTILTNSRLAHNELLSDEEGRALARQAFVSDSFILIRSAVAGVGLFAPFLLFLVAAGTLLWLDPVLTAEIAVALAIFSVPFWRLNRGVVAAARNYKKLAPVRSVRLKSLFEYISHTHASEPEPQEILDGVLLDPATVGAEMAVGGIMLRGHKVNFLRFVFLGVVLCGLLFATGTFLAAEERSWTALATYAVSLQYAVAAMASVATSLTGVARFVPYLERMRLLTAHRPSVLPEGTETAAVARVQEPRLPGSKTDRALQAGDVLFCAHPRTLTTFDIPAFIERLTGCRDEAARLAVESFFCGRPPPGVVQEPLHTAAGEARLDSRTRSYLGFLMPGLLSGRRLFVLDWGALAALSAEDTAAIFAQLKDRVTILVSVRIPRSLPVAADGVAIMGERRLLGLGDADWLRGLDREHELLRVFRDQVGQAGEAADDEPEDDLLLS